MKKTITTLCTGAAISLLLAGNASAATINFKDPKGDDNGPGEYVYPTDGVYAPGSFDLTGFKVKSGGNKVTFSASVASKLKDPWGMGTGFAVQMIFVFIDTDGKEGSGHTQGLPGLNVQFDPKHSWDKVVVLSPQKKPRVEAEIRTKASEFAADIVIPNRTGGKGKTISGKVKLADLGGGDPETWGYQVIVQSNEGFPAKTDLLSRKVNEYEGQHRFGGGNDGDCDPHVIDILAGDSDGSNDELKAQHQMLSYQCDESGNAVKRATLTMIRK